VLSCYERLGRFVVHLYFVAVPLFQVFVSLVGIKVRRKDIDVTWVQAWIVPTVRSGRVASVAVPVTLEREVSLTDSEATDHVLSYQRQINTIWGGFRKTSITGLFSLLS